jgi:hypothetical protein
MKISSHDNLNVNNEFNEKGKREIEEKRIGGISSSSLIPPNVKIDPQAILNPKKKDKEIKKDKKDD